MKDVKVIQNEKEVPTEIIAESILAISEGIKRLRNGMLNDKALVLLIQHAAPSVKYNGGKLSATEVRAVLDGMESLERAYLTKGSKKS